MNVSNRKRWIVPWKNSRTKPAIYHCISRVVDRSFVFEQDEREHFRMLMRMCEKFTGCRVLSYCIMSNHFHLLLEVPPMPEDGISDDELLERLGAFYTPAYVAQVAQVAQEMAALAEPRVRGEFEMSPVDDNGVPLTMEQEMAMAQQQADRQLAEIRKRYTRRMHDLSEFMKSLLERFTKWFNRTHTRSGTLWEDRYKSVIVEDGIAARMMAAYIDLNPVRAGMVKDPAEYRWSSYGEALGGGKTGNGKTARAGLVRAWHCNEKAGDEAELWPEVSRFYRRMMGIELGKKPGHTRVEKTGQQVTKTAEELLQSEDNETVLKDLSVTKMLHCRVRYFSDGAVIGSRAFVDGIFRETRERFGPKRKDGARKLRGAGSAASEWIWSARDLKKEIV
jgi:REP element-mobilizing transposase RayT